MRRYRHPTVCNQKQSRATSNNNNRKPFSIIIFISPFYSNQVIQSWWPNCYHILTGAVQSSLFRLVRVQRRLHGLIGDILFSTLQPTHTNETSYTYGYLWWTRVSKDTKEGAKTRAPLSVIASHIQVFFPPVSSWTAWHVQIRASIQLVQIQVFVNCLISIKATGKPAIRKG